MENHLDDVDWELIDICLSSDVLPIHMADYFKEELAKEIEADAKAQEKKAGAKKDEPKAPEKKVTPLVGGGHHSNGNNRAAIFEYDAKGKCVDCGGEVGRHAQSCKLMARAMGMGD